MSNLFINGDIQVVRLTRIIMGQVYILKLEKGKWYVGYTERAIKRILQHANKKGAKWTKKYPPVEPVPYSMSEPIYSKEDEDRITLSLMAEHGIKNVRGGKWCMVVMRAPTVREINKLLSKVEKGVKCDRCGRNSHSRSQCYAATTVDGVKITSKNWKYKPAKTNVFPPSKKSRAIRPKDVVKDKISAYDSLRKRGVFCEDASMNLNVRGMWRIFTKYSSSPELSDPEWYEILKKNHTKFGRRPLISLYPPEHWFHDPVLFNEELSKKFENDGYLWTASGAAVNPKIRALQLEEIERIRTENQALKEQRRLERLKAKEKQQLEREELQRETERQKETERQRLIDEEEAKENHRKECMEKLRTRGVLVEHSMATTQASFVRNLKANMRNDEFSAKWLDYFNTVSRRFDLSLLYPVDHWMHESEKFDSSLSVEFEHDGFGWTESGFAAKNPNPSKKNHPKSETNDSTTDGIDIVFESIAKEIEKAGKSVRKELGKLKKEFRKRTGL